ncbi:hypothetical protein HDU98_002666 [Podochytrium sp. JEL0797]|nr:hypothetical protein HDU98_002666 [Podochytrium sp. JEL0797]
MDVATEILRLRKETPTLSIKQVHDVLSQQGNELSLSKVKKEFSKVSKMLLDEQQLEAQAAALGKEANVLWTKALGLQRDGLASEALRTGASAFLKYPDFPTESTASQQPDQDALIESSIQLTVQHEDHNTNTKDTHSAFLIAAGLCLLNKDLKNAVGMVDIAQASLRSYAAADPAALSPADFATRSADIYALSGSLRMELMFYKDSVTDLDKSVDLKPHDIRIRQLRCVARFKATKFAGVVEDATIIKEHAEKEGATEFLTGPCFAAAMVSFMGAKVAEGNSWIEDGNKNRAKFSNLGPDPRIMEMALEAQQIFNKEK